MEGFNLFYEFNGNKRNFFCNQIKLNSDLYEKISKLEELPQDLFKIYLDGKILNEKEKFSFKKNDIFVNIAIPLLGGKGGFGSMLRAIGAQIEKTTNKEACRDLNGRRFRDVNIEKRLRNWIKKKSELEKQIKKKRLEKLEKMTQDPKLEFKDEEYFKQKEIIPEKIDNAVNYVLQKKNNSTIVVDDNKPSTSNANLEKITTESKSKEIKRKLDEPSVISKKKKTQLWLGDDLENDSEDE